MSLMLDLVGGALASIYGPWPSSAGLEFSVRQDDPSVQLGPAHRGVKFIDPGLYIVNAVIPVRVHITSDAESPGRVGAIMAWDPGSFGSGSGDNG